MLIYVICGVLCLFVVLYSIYMIIQTGNKIDDMERKIYDRIQNIENTLICVEQRTAFFVPKKGKDRTYVYLGSTTEDDNYIGIGRVMNILLERFNLSVKRIEPMYNEEKILLVGKKKEVKK